MRHYLNRVQYDNITRWGRLMLAMAWGGMNRYSSFYYMQFRFSNTPVLGLGSDTRAEVVATDRQQLARAVTSSTGA